jgi:hypothetical protein
MRVLILFKFFPLPFLPEMSLTEIDFADQTKIRHNDSQFSVIFPQFPVSFFRVRSKKTLPRDNNRFGI